jgi:hypothetical protein
MWIQSINLNVVQSKYVFVSMVTLPIISNPQNEMAMSQSTLEKKKRDDETIIETVIDHDLILHTLIC